MIKSLVVLAIIVIGALMIASVVSTTVENFSKFPEKTGLTAVCTADSHLTGGRPAIDIGCEEEP
jgi:hypothetical protein